MLCCIGCFVYVVAIDVLVCLRRKGPAGEGGVPAGGEPGAGGPAGGPWITGPDNLLYRVHMCTHIYIYIYIHVCMHIHVYIYI